MEAPLDADHRKEETWIAANPAYGDLNSKADFESMVKRTPEAEFRTKRCNQWVSSQTAWLPAGASQGLRVQRELSVDDEIVLFLRRTALWGMARKNGKSALITGLGLWFLFNGDDGGEVVS